MSVSDNGRGMSRETQTHIFEPFYTTKETGKGTGLGLSTAYGIVKQCGGFIEVYSELGQGTTFKIYLPRVGEILETPQRVAAAGSLHGSETVLVAEDDDMVRELTCHVLQTYGYKVLEARHGGEALLVCERHKGPIKLMVTDVVMPQMSGPELAERLGPLHPEMKVLYMSGYAEEAIVQHKVLEAADSFIQKPFMPVSLAEKVRRILDAV
jgi:CheY-like chemotaxis protein